MAKTTTKKKARRTAFVPRLILRTAIAGVIPACALACGGSDSSPGSSDTGFVGGVAEDAYGGDSRFGVADTAYPDVHAVADAAYGDSDTRFGVADTAYPDTGRADVPAEASDAPGEVDDGGAPDVFGVAAVAYPAYEGGVPG
jgi:hypothetical protein